MKRLLLAVLMLGLIGGCASQTGQGAPPQAQASSTPEGNLATIESRATGQSKDSLKVAFARELDDLQLKCSSDKRSRLADYTVNTHDILEKQGIHETHLAILTTVGRSVPSSGKIDCKDAFTVYALMRQGH